eukprot:scaffold181537_cov21-Tisochrysis_lutea.AAC.1
MSGVKEVVHLCRAWQLNVKARDLALCLVRPNCTADNTLCLSPQWLHHACNACTVDNTLGQSPVAAPQIEGARPPVGPQPCLYSRPVLILYSRPVLKACTHPVLKACTQGLLKVPDPHGGRALVDHGVHAFIVPLRNDAGQLLPGVEIHDCGYKVRRLCSIALGHCESMRTVRDGHEQFAKSFTFNFSSLGNSSLNSFIEELVANSCSCKADAQLVGFRRVPQPLVKIAKSRVPALQQKIASSCINGAVLCVASEPNQH